MGYRDSDLSLGVNLSSAGLLRRFDYLRSRIDEKPTGGTVECWFEIPVGFPNKFKKLVVVFGCVWVGSPIKPAYSM